MLASIISLAILMQERVHSWSHDDMQHWVDTWPECGLQSQSPIDLPVNIDVSDCDDPLVLDWTSEIQHFAVCTFCSLAYKYSYCKIWNSHNVCC